jgi:hypothetical protein
LGLCDKHRIKVLENKPFLTRSTKSATGFSTLLAVIREMISLASSNGLLS